MSDKEIILPRWTMTALLFISLLTICFAALSALNFWMDKEKSKTALDMYTPDEEKPMEYFYIASEYDLKSKAYKNALIIGVRNLACFIFLAFYYIKRKQGYQLLIAASRTPRAMK